MSIRYSQFLSNMKSYMEDIIEKNQTLIISYTNNKNIVMLSEEKYNFLTENLHIMKDKANYEWLMESKKQLEEGLAKSQNFIK